MYKYGEQYHDILTIIKVKSHDSEFYVVDLQVKLNG